jgi:hypothetical protein
VNAKIEHSDDGSSWSDVPGAVFPPISVAVSGQSVDLDTRVAKKFVRLNYTAVGGTPNVGIVAFISGRRKRIN